MFDNINVMNEKLLIEPHEIKTNGGIVLPQTSNNNNEERITVNCGRVVKIGKGYPVFSHTGNESNIWENTNRTITSFVPLQIKEHDLVYYIANQAVEIFYGNKKLIIIPEYLVLFYERKDDHIKREIENLIGGTKP